MCGDHCFRSYSIAAASRGRCAVCSGHRDDERSLRVAGLPRRKGTRETTYAAMAYVDDRAAILAYHEATKHSPISVRARAHDLDWNNRPSSFKVYADLERIPLPQDILPLDVPALEAIGVTSVPDPAPGPDLAALARLLVRGAGVHHTKTFSDSEVLYFRNYASAGALYPIEVYVGCADLPGLPGGVYHFDPRGSTLTRLREGDHRGHLVGAAAGEPAVARAPVVLALTGIPWRTAWKYTERGYGHQGILQANDAGRLDAPKEARTWRRSMGGDEKVEPTAPPSSDAAPDSLEDVLRRRGSARIFAPGTIPAAVLRTILERATVGIPTDYALVGARLIKPYLIANAIQNLNPNTY